MLYTVNCTLETVGKCNLTDAANMNILVVDDHPMTAHFYESFLKDYFSGIGSPVRIAKALNCEHAYQSITRLNDSAERYDLAILDYNLPSFSSEKINSGIDIALLLRQYCPGCKIIMITGHAEALVVYEIIKKAHPEGIATKSDVTAENFPELLNMVVSGNYYQSATVKACALKIWEKDIMVDDHNRRIILHLSRGYKVKDLQGAVGLPASTIQKRIINIRKTLGVSDEGNLLRELERKGFI